MSNLFLFMNKYTLDHNYHRHVSHPTPNSRTENTIVGVPAVFANIICVRKKRGLLFYGHKIILANTAGAGSIGR